MATNRTDEDGIRRLVSESLSSMLAEWVDVEYTPGVPVRVMQAQALAKRLMDIALFAEKDKDSLTASKLIMEFTEGKPGVKKEQEDRETLALGFTIQNDDGVIPCGLPDLSRFEEAE